MPQANISSRSGFTLVEIMIVVVIIGLLAAMAIPAFQKSRVSSQASRIANDFRVLAGAFETAALENGVFPADGNGNELPVEAAPYIKSDNWTNAPAEGGYWDWEGAGRHGVSASINLVDSDQVLESGVMERVDRLLDDGNFGSGLFRRIGSNEYIYILEL